MNCTSFGADPMRQPFVEITVNGKAYSPGDKIDTRPGERLKITASLKGGRRDYCSMPEKYANIGQTTEIVSKGDDGMFFTVQGGGQFRGEWQLANETAKFSSSGEVVIEPLPQQGVKQTEAFVTLPKSGLSQTYLKVRANTLWKYQRTTPAGVTNQEETNQGEGSFTLVLTTTAGGWYSSENIVVSGTENFSVRNKLDQVQRFYKEIETALQAKNFNAARMHVANLQTSINSLKTEIERQKRENSNFECEVSLLGTPTDLTMGHLGLFQKMSDHWKNEYMIAQGNTQKINALLLNKQMNLTNNIMKSVMKNYIDWYQPIPNNLSDLIYVYEPTRQLTKYAYPLNIMEWYSNSLEDASILKDQVQGVSMLKQLQTFYSERASKTIAERKEIVDLVNALLPTKAIDEQLKTYLGGLSWLKWTSKQEK
ncbi:MAG TPA: hypothetical protein DIW50_06430 [Prolixibacteraceae bacterium]|nr:MAG: hypothetical protein A2W89_24020 [Bacteroidetes bacterium GWE2_42_39]HCR90086.1 hypothetical protein [Prolixibacteraceae bacterium]